MCGRSVYIYNMYMYETRVDLVMYDHVIVMFLDMYTLIYQDASVYEKVLKVECNASQIDNQRLEL